jgi:dipeptidase
MFHILADDTGAAAVWVAQRIPDDHISVAANGFVIREVDPNSTDFLYSSNLWSVAENMGWWNESMGLLDFKRTYAAERHRPDYSNQRVWRVLSLAAPSANLPLASDPLGDVYPFSIKVDSPLSAQDMMRFQRDHYEGTEIDMTKGLAAGSLIALYESSLLLMFAYCIHVLIHAAGPYGDPNRTDRQAT